MTGARVVPLAGDDPVRLGPYRLLGRLGAGGMGRVYLAREDGADGPLAAVKTLLPEGSSEWVDRQRFAREARLAQRVESEHTVRVRGADPDGDPPWLALDYVPAPSLGELVRTAGRLPGSAVRWLAAGTAEALMVLHAHRIVHRDVKPSNILLPLDGPRLIDFGISHAADLTRTGLTLGTLTFTSPEQARGERSEAASDVYSLGATLFHLAVGRPPYPVHQDTLHLLALVQHNRLDLTGLPKELIPLVVPCLAAAPADRPTPAELHAAFLASLDGLPVSSSGSRWLPPRWTALIGAYERRGRDLERAHPPGPAPIPGGPGESTPARLGRVRRSGYVPAPSAGPPTPAAPPATSGPAPSGPAPSGPTPGVPAPSAPASASAPGVPTPGRPSIDAPSAAVGPPAVRPPVEEAEAAAGPVPAPPVVPSAATVPLRRASVPSPSSPSPSPSSPSPSPAPAGPAERRPEPPRTRWWPVLLAGVLVFVVAAGAVILRPWQWGGAPGAGGATARITTPPASPPATPPTDDPGLIANLAFQGVAAGECLRTERTPGGAWSTPLPEEVACDAPGAYLKVLAASPGVHPGDCPGGPGRTNWTHPAPMAETTLCVERQYREGDCFPVREQGGQPKVRAEDLLLRWDCAAPPAAQGYDAVLRTVAVRPAPLPADGCRRGPDDTAEYRQLEVNGGATVLCTTRN
ncbi:serine/threonine-protein kinase [Kitasatospora sp. NPDC096147]|uniref:serine/threonine-protein kinase n=1 Tax=Kitasatospora sp. NPDC096147 TaxID=3364093 RepID=UPI00380AA35D